MLPFEKSCIAAVGDKSGRMLFFVVSQDKVVQTLSFQVSDSWLSKIIWVDWKEEGQTCCKSKILTLDTYFATASIDGSIKIWIVTYSNGNLQVNLFQQVCQADRLLVTSLSFDKDSEFLKLVFAKGYSISMWSMKPETNISSVRLPCYMNISCKFLVS